MLSIENYVNEIFEELKTLNTYLYEHPELGNHEFLALEAHTKLLSKYGFTVETNFIGLETAFKATYDSGKPGITIALMDEYDALPDIGHGCGHNMIGTIGSGTGIVLKKMADDLGGKIIVLGTPAEETNGAKVYMAEKGVFDDIDIAMMAHPSSESCASIDSLAMVALQYEFTGKTAHAASAPEKGINALDAVISTFNSINALRQHIQSTARVHGIITEGGVAANIVPERAVAQFYVRATSKTYLKELVEKVNNCAKGAALATGATLDISNFEISYDNFVKNPPLNELLEKNMNQFKMAKMIKVRKGSGSLDAGNVSQVCPTVHPMFSISEADVAGHTRAFATATLTPFAIEQMRKMICSLAQTGVDLIKDPTLVQQIKDAFEQAEK